MEYVLFELSLSLDISDAHCISLIRAFNTAVGTTLVKMLQKAVKEDPEVEEVRLPFKNFGEYVLKIRRRDDSVNICPSFEIDPSMLCNIDTGFFGDDVKFLTEVEEFKFNFETAISQESELVDDEEVDLAEICNDDIDDTIHVMISALATALCSAASGETELLLEIDQHGTFKVTGLDSDVAVGFEPDKAFKLLCKNDELISNM